MKKVVNRAYQPDNVAKSMESLVDKSNATLNLAEINLKINEANSILKEKNLSVVRYKLSFLTKIFENLWLLKQAVLL